MPQTVAARLTWLGDGFAPDIRVVIGADGRIASVGREERPVTVALPDCAVLPGFVNTHSHAFQRGLRGHGETFPLGAGTFWTWRDAMYELVKRLDADEVYEVSRQAFEEMLDAGITTVGEFHYLRHAVAGNGYALDEVVMRAAADAGIRLVLLAVFYGTGGIGLPLTEAQRRFASPTLEAYWRQLERLSGLCQRETQTLGVVAHSIRAASLPDIAALYRGARDRALPFHMHVEEQRKEIDECVAAYGRPPMAMLLDTLELDGGFTAVHCTHTDPDDMKRFLSGGGTVCVCPLTEANLGDGVPDLKAILSANGSISLGTDSNARISMIEEMRWLEYGQRLVRESRGVIRDETGGIAPRLLRMATAAGATALGVPTGEIAVGDWGDLVAIDLNTPGLTGIDPAQLLEAIVFGTGNDVVADVCVGGAWRRRG